VGWPAGRRRARSPEWSSQPGVPDRDPSGRPLTRPPLIRWGHGGEGEGTPMSRGLTGAGCCKPGGFLRARGGSGESRNLAAPSTRHRNSHAWS
jgi:hypothetical protein